jgi:hypothetical protein
MIEDEYKHIKTELGALPDQFDIAIVPIDIGGSIGELNKLVLETYGDPDPASTLRKLNLKKGYEYLISDLKPILFIVTIGNGNTGVLLKKNLTKAIKSNQSSLKGAKVWIPLMGTGTGGLDFVDSYDTTAGVVKEFNNISFTIAIPNNEKGIDFLKNNKVYNLQNKGELKGNIKTGSKVKGDLTVKKPIKQPGYDNLPQFKMHRLVRDILDKQYNLNLVIDAIVIRMNVKHKFDLSDSQNESYAQLIEKSKFIGVKSDSSFTAGTSEVGIMTTIYADIENKINFLQSAGTKVQKYFAVFSNKFTKDNIDYARKWFENKQGLDVTVLSFDDVIELATKNGIDHNEYLKKSLSKNEEQKEQDPSEQNKFQSNELTLTTPINDGATAPVDLLDFENDIRAFSVTLAQKKLKPPLAIALFGNWGSGKSFFMHHLSKKIDFLSVHQSFNPIEADQKADVKENEKPFCEGVVQINFNAWSYLDSNLWAGLVSTIFEKLDEYISSQNKGEKEKIEAQKIVADNLEIATHEKEILSKEKDVLISEQMGYELKIKVIEGQKETLYDEVINKSISDLVRDAKKELTELEKSVKQELDDYGISQQKIDELSPSALLEEVSSWLTFLKNLFKFRPKQLIIFGLLVLTLLIYHNDPGGYLAGLKAYLNDSIIYFIGIISPVFYKFYNTVLEYKKLLSPITEYRNQFNKKFEEVKLDYETSRNTLKERIFEKEAQIHENEKKLEKVETQIEEYEFALKHSITKRAFYNFISRKAKDENYEKHLGLISVIRRDFEALSTLFAEVIKPPNLSTKEEKKEWIDRLKKDEHFKGLFKKPLDRIILYIDDLDRCSDEKVLEVLQAVHLLMAFPLFIVVVGVDKRCVSNALRYRDMLQYGKKVHINNLSELKDKFGIDLIEPREYLEKIFQIPFHLKNAEPAAIKRLIHETLSADIKHEEESEQAEQPTEKPEIKEDKPELVGFENPKTKNTNDDGNLIKLINPNHEDLKISQTELDYLKNISILVGNTPRTIKRFINIYRIIRTHEQLTFKSENREQDFLVVMFILALAIGDFKKSSHTINNLFDSYQERDLKVLLNTKVDENKKTFDPIVLEELKLLAKNLESSDALRPLLKVKGEEFTRFSLFVNRFSFGEDLVIKSTNEQLE